MSRIETREVPESATAPVFDAPVGERELRLRIVLVVFAVFILFDGSLGSAAEVLADPFLAFFVIPVFVLAAITQIALLRQRTMVRLDADGVYVMNLNRRIPWEKIKGMRDHQEPLFFGKQQSALVLEFWDAPGRTFWDRAFRRPEYSIEAELLGCAPAEVVQAVSRFPKAHHVRKSQTTLE